MALFNTLLYGAEALLALIPGLYLLANVLNLPVLSFISRFLASIIALIICASYGVVASICLRLAGYGGLCQWTVARSFKYTMRLLTGVTFTISDPSASLKVRPAVFIGNHQSELDVLMLGCMFPPYCSVTSKASLKYWPFLGWFMLLSKTVFINRSNNREARVAFAEAVKTMQKDRQSVFIFPEGTRSYASEPRLLPFKKGAFHLAVEAGVPIVPVVVANYSGVLDIKRKIFVSGEIPVSVLKPIETKGMTSEDVNALVVRVQKQMEDELIRVSAVAQKNGIAGPARQAQGLETAVKSR